MDDYLREMEKFSPNDFDATDIVMKEEPVRMVDSPPLQTTLLEDNTLRQDDIIPKYLAPKKIEVRRYILKK